MKLGLYTPPLEVDENRPTRSAIMEIISAEGLMDDAFNALAESMFEEALAAIGDAETALQGARAAIEKARAERINRKEQN